jgi:hypothetical protein
MADNVTVTAGSYSATVAADDIAGIHYQRVKIGIGADGSSADLAFGQAAMASSLPVTLASNQATAVSTFDHGSNLDVDTAAEQIVVASVTARYGVWVTADSLNGGVIYLGNSDVTASGTEATDGYPLHAGEAVFIQVDNANKVYAVATAVNQKLYWRTE